MTLQERSDLILAFARVLYVNGQATEQMFGAVERISAVRWDHARRSFRAGGNCSSKRRTTAAVYSPQSRPTLPAWTWIGSPPQCGPSKILAPAALHRTQPCRRSAKYRGHRRRRRYFSRWRLGQAPWRCGDLRCRALVPVILIFVSATSGAVLRRGLAKLSTNVFGDVAIRGVTSTTAQRHRGDGRPHRPPYGPVSSSSFRF
jgi:hypothetical protein